MELRFRGVRGSVPTPQADRLRYGGNTLCVEVASADPAEPVMIDCGTGARELGQELLQRRGVRRIHLLLTHFHWDHIQGMPYFAPLFEPEMELVVYAHRSEAETRRLLKTQMGDPYFPLPLGEMTARLQFRCVAPGRRFAAGGIDVECFPLHHPQGAAGYRLEQDGVVCIHACDHEGGHAAADAELRRTAREAHLLVMDAQYTPEEYATRRGWGHSTYAQAAEAAQAAGVGQLVLIHHDPGHDDAFLDGMLDGAREIFAPAEMARESESLRVEPGRVR